MKNLGRILILGSGGAGKSTLARQIAARTRLPLHYIDHLHWNPGWEEATPTQIKRRLDPILKRKAWILDGAPGVYRDRCVRSADTVVFLDPGRFACLARVVWRQVHYFGRVRPEMAGGCTETLDLKYLRWVWNYPAKSRPALMASLAKVGKNQKLVVLRKSKQIRDFLESLS